jgi:lysosomal alpha-mannosidase
VNVSRILDGVVGNLGNDTKKRRRFVWDEMYFLEWWWTNRATVQQQATFQQLVREGRIEFVDNGWSQHDMGCTAQGARDTGVQGVYLNPLGLFFRGSHRAF